MSQKNDQKFDLSRNKKFYYNFNTICLPYQIRHFKFLKFDFKFIIGDPKTYKYKC